MFLPDSTSCCTNTIERLESGRKYRQAFESGISVVANSREQKIPVVSSIIPEGEGCREVDEG